MTNKYITVQGDMWDIIALKTLGDEKYMSEIIQANYKYRDIIVFASNVEIIIPQIIAKIIGRTAPWKK